LLVGIAFSSKSYHSYDEFVHNVLNTGMTGPYTAGTSHLELNAEFWALKLISAVITDDSFASWVRDGQRT
jgi:hypothetical protein